MAKSWKDYVLRSGIPFEYEVGRTVSSHGFEIESDFSFMRNDGTGRKEMSVDMLATYSGTTLEYAAYLLIECKYRSPGKSILLLPDPNMGHGMATLGGTTAQFDAFVPYHLAIGAFQDMEAQYAFVSKGVEIHEQDSAVEREFRRGIQQLRYAAPAAVYRALDFATYSGLEETHSAFFAKVLVTNAPLLVLNDGVDVAAIEAADSIEDITTPTEVAVLHSDFGPDYEEHCRMTFSTLGEALGARAEDAERHIKKEGKRFEKYESPTAVVKDLMSANRRHLMHFGTQFFIVNTKGLDRFVAQYRECCETAYSMRRKRKAKFVETAPLTERGSDGDGLDAAEGSSEDSEVKKEA